MKPMPSLNDRRSCAIANAIHEDAFECSIGMLNNFMIVCFGLLASASELKIRRN